MLGLVVLGSRTWICTTAAPALAASSADWAICCGVTGTAGFLLGVSKEPVRAQVMTILRATRCLPVEGRPRPAAALRQSRLRADVPQLTARCVMDFTRAKPDSTALNQARRAFSVGA